MEIKLAAIPIEKPAPFNFILGQTHFIKSVEDIHEAMVGAVPGIKFGLAFCEASGKCLVRWTGTDPAMIELAEKERLGHRRRAQLHPVPWRRLLSCQRAQCSQDGARGLPGLLRHCQSDSSAGCGDVQGRGIVGVVDGFPPKGMEGDADIEWRRKFLRQIGYKL